MSNIFITDIVGTIGIPGNDVQLASATAALDGLLSGVANLTYDRVLAWVEDQAGPDGSEGVRTLNCMVEKFTYLGDECPSEANVDAAGTAIEAALEGDPSITSIGQQQYHLFQTGAYFWWQRDSAGGFLYPTISTDDIAVGGHVAPKGKWFDDGDLVLGDSTMTGAERLRVAAGGVRVEKSDAGAVPGIYVQAYSSHPVGQPAALLDVDVNSIGLDIDSEATSKPLINLQALNANTRGDIAFGTARTADAVSPFEGDLWYNSTDNYYRYYDGAATQTLARLTDLTVFGNNRANAASDALSSTSSTAYQQKLRLSVASVPAGTYRIGVSFLWSYSNAARNFDAQVQVDDTTTIWYMYVGPARGSATERIPASGFAYVTFGSSGNHDIDLDYRASNVVDTAYIILAKLEFWRTS